MRAVTRNYSEKSINSILDYISTLQQVRVCHDNALYCDDMYEPIPHARWNFCKISMRLRSKHWRRQGMIDCGSRLIPRYGHVVAMSLSYSLTLTPSSYHFHTVAFTQSPSHSRLHTSHCHSHALTLNTSYCTFHSWVSCIMIAVTSHDSVELSVNFTNHVK